MSEQVISGWRGNRFMQPKAVTRFVVALGVGIVAAIVSGLVGGWGYAPAIGWAAAALTLALWIWVVIGRLNPSETRRHATVEDPSRRTTDALVLVANVASIAAIGYVIVQARSAHGATEGWLAALALGTGAASWLLVHTLFTVRYARLYYSGSAGGIDFNQGADEPPRYLEFAYLAFTIGMTYQVSDTNLESYAIRGTAFRHGLLSYVFGSVVLASTINLVVSLSTGG